MPDVADRKVGFTPSVINHDQSFSEYLADERVLTGSDERKRMCDEVGASDNIVPSIDPDVFERLPEQRPATLSTLGSCFVSTQVVNSGQVTSCSATSCVSYD